VAAPDLALISTRSTQSGRVSRPSRQLLALLRHRTGSLRRSGACLWVAQTVNQRRTLEPVMTTVGPQRALEHRVERGSARRFRTLLREAHDAADEFARLLEWDISGASEDLVQSRLRDAALSVLRAEIAMRGEPRVVVVATQHDLAGRALLAVARRNETPTVYFPHAPLADNPWYRDLPVDYAGLRGEAEADRYVAWGARPDGLHVVGNPSIDRVEAPVPEGPVIVAVSPWPRDQVRRFLARVAEHVPEAVLAPHPGSDLQDLRRCAPASWRLPPKGTTTFDLMRAGTSLVIQRSSGVAWEAAALGLPVIDVRPADEEPNYPFIHDVAVRAWTPQEFQAAMTASAQPASEKAARLTAAARWCSTVGRTAAFAARALLEHAGRRGPAPSPVLDGWGPTSGPQADGQVRRS
jgi:hypothetical protein